VCVRESVCIRECVTECAFSVQYWRVCVLLLESIRECVCLRECVLESVYSLYERMYSPY